MVLPTPRLYANLHAVIATCKHCDHNVKLDLAALIEAGHGDTPLIHLPLRCKECNQRGHVITVLGNPYRS
jgi:hypothetical protein